jgi:hypothetical protein
MSTEEQRQRHREYMAAYIRRKPEQAEKARQRTKAWRLANPERKRAYAADPDRRAREYAAKKAKYAADPSILFLQGLRERGVTLDEYNTQLELQGGGCWFCGETEPLYRVRWPIKRLFIDHDHETGRIRGILCTRCNLSLSSHERGRRSLLLSPDRIAVYLTHNVWLTKPPAPLAGY